MRALEAIAQRTDVPANVREAGMLGIYIMGLRPVLAAPWAMVKPLLDEMFDSCLSIQTNANPPLLRGAGTPDIKAVGRMMDEDIEEVATRLYLRDQIMELHTGFSVAAGLSQMWGNLMAAAAALNTPSTPTSPEGSASQSPPVKPPSLN